jgi:hypothetical protein
MDDLLAEHGDLALGLSPCHLDPNSTELVWESVNECVPSKCQVDNLVAKSRG